VQNDTVAAIYSGALGRSDLPSYQALVTMTYPAKAEAATNVYMIADRMQVVARGQVPTSSSAVESQGHAIYEYMPGSNNSSINSFARLIPAGAQINTLAITSDNNTLIGGSFSLDSASNIAVILPNGSYTSINGGLNGIVTTVMATNTTAFVGGNFSSTADGKIQVKHIGKIENNTWSSLDGGLDGLCTSIVSFREDLLLISGNFTHTLSENGTADVAPGIAYWNMSTNEWSSPAVFIKGTNVSSAIPGLPSGSDNWFLAGQISAADSFVASGLASLTMQDNGLEVSTLLLQSKSIARQASLSPRMATEIVLDPSGTNLVSAGLYYNATDSSGVVSITRIIGGHFTAGEAENIGTVADGSDVLLALSGGSIEGTVLALALVNDTLLVGGSFQLIVNGAVRSRNLAVYDLKGRNFADDQVSIGQTDETFVSVLERRLGTDQIIIGGSYDSDTNVPCQDICIRDLSTSSWTLLGSGFQGSVNAVVVPAVSLPQLDHVIS